MVFLHSLTNFILQPVTLGLFFNDLLAAAGLRTGVATYSIGALFCCALPASIACRGISPSMKGAPGFLFFESLVVVAPCLTVAFHPQQPLDASGFRLTASPGGASGLFQAMVFAMLSYCGFDVLSTLAEEAKLARTLIPQATLWWGTTSTFFAMITFVFVNLILFRERAFQSVSGFLLHCALALTGVLVDVYLLYRSFFIELWAQGWATGRSVIVFDVACAVIALRRPPLLAAT